MALTVVLVTLKLTDVISWSWWWVTVPLWWDVLLVGSVILLVVLIVFCAILFGTLLELFVKK
tara:strand:- start:530 stop:715 length:186 start_codon:yes stop_codon:yes gene_type:complete